MLANNIIITGQNSGRGYQPTIGEQMGWYVIAVSTVSHNAI